MSGMTDGPDYVLLSFHNMHILTIIIEHHVSQITSTGPVMNVSTWLVHFILLLTDENYVTLESDESSGW